MPVSTGVTAGGFVGAWITVFPVNAESGSPARFDRTHDTSRRGGQGSSMPFPTGVAVARQHVRDFQLGTIHELALSTEP